MKVKLLTAMEMRMGMMLSCLPAGRVTARILMRGERNINSCKQFLFRSSCEVPCSVVRVVSVTAGYLVMHAKRLVIVKGY